MEFLHQQNDNNPRIAYKLPKKSLCKHPAYLNIKNNSQTGKGIIILCCLNKKILLKLTLKNHTHNIKPINIVIQTFLGHNTNTCNYEY